MGELHKVPYFAKSHINRWRQRRRENNLRAASIIGSVTMEVFGLANRKQIEETPGELEILLEAARRATWDALHGPRHLRTGRFRPEAEIQREAPVVEGGGERRPNLDR